MKSNLIPIYLLAATISIIFTSCYDYGKSHEPYTNAPIDYHLPPPPTKIVASPDTKKEYMQKTYTEIKNTLEEADVQMIDDSIKVLFPNNIIYKSKDVLPSSEYEEPLQKFAVLLNKYTKTNILIVGHSDSKGNEKANKALSSVRALNIKNSLINYYVKNYRLKSWGIGSASPIANNQTSEGRDKNRRVEFVILYQEK